MKLTDDVKEIKGIGEKSAKLLAKLGIYSIGNLLEHYPRNYDVFSMPVPVSDVAEGMTVTVEGMLSTRFELRRVRNLQILSCRISDPSGSIRLKWFNSAYIQRQLKPGTRYLFRGKIVRKNAELVIEQPKLYTREEYRRLLSVMQPVYPLCEGITSNFISKSVRTVLPLVEFGTDIINANLRKKYGFMRYSDALCGIHFPKDRDELLEARRRLVFDEFFMFAVSVRRMKQNKEKNINPFNIKRSKELDKMIAGLPYRLTGAQEKVLRQVREDLGSSSMMSRMIQGDVGSGKTIIAIAAILETVMSGYQAAIMVPTEVLAKQHYEELCEKLSVFGVKIQLLVGSMTQAEKRKAYEVIKNHEADVIVGTHALIQEKVEYSNMALAVIDEQHRFGVRQREILMKKNSEMHVLVMSATPIPRSLAILLYGELDLSVIDEMPSSRLPIKNCVVDTGYRNTAYNFIKKQIAEGRQAYIICPMVDENEELELENVTEYTEKLKSIFDDSSTSVEMLHGKMKPSEKNRIMEEFGEGKIKILISTTVVEVGINVPNATVMMIENSERFGLAQLHQLRGRVGRGRHQSYCIFVKGVQSKEASERLDTLVKYNDGFKIAEQDLKLRGPGDIFGIRQSGELDFKLADIYTDAELLRNAAEAAGELSEDELGEIIRMRSDVFSAMNSQVNVI